MWELLQQLDLWRYDGAFIATSENPIFETKLLLLVHVFYDIEVEK